MITIMKFAHHMKSGTGQLKLVIAKPAEKYFSMKEKNEIISRHRCAVLDKQNKLCSFVMPAI